jgi:hypothetical protein
MHLLILTKKGWATFCRFFTNLSGTDVMILKNIFGKKIAKKLAFLNKNKAKLCKILIITLVFNKNANIFAENWQTSQ